MKGRNSYRQTGLFTNITISDFYTTSPLTFLYLNIDITIYICYLLEALSLFIILGAKLEVTEATDVIFDQNRYRYFLRKFIAFAAQMLMTS